MKLYCVIDVVMEVDATKEKEYEIYDQLFSDLSECSSDVLITSVTRLESNQWQFVLYQAEYAYWLCLEIEKRLKSHQNCGYYGIGVGPISTDVNSDSRLMDGQAFILARESLETAMLKKSNYSKVIPTRNCRIYFRCWQKESDEKLINLFIQNNEVLRSRITAKQMESIELYETYGSYTELMKHHPKIKKGTLSDKMNKSNYWMIQSNQRTIQRLLQDLQSAE